VTLASLMPDIVRSPRTLPYKHVRSSGDGEW